MSEIQKSWNNSRHQMPLDMTPVWITERPSAKVYPAVFYKGERIDQGSECFSWRIDYPESGIKASSIEHQFWMLRESAPPPLKPDPRGSIHEADKAKWVYSQFTTPFEFDQYFWIYDEVAGVILAKLIRLDYGGDTHGFPVFRAPDGVHFYGRRYYMPLLYPQKPS